MLKEALKEKTLSPQEVRAILNTDNKEIVELCKRASILPRKNSKGQTYFSYDEVKNLRRVQAQKRSVTNPMVTQVQKQPSAMRSILASLQQMENTLSDKIAKVIDEKLEGMDEVVVELIRCKTDNEKFISSKTTSTVINISDLAYIGKKNATFGNNGKGQANPRFPLKTHEQDIKNKELIQWRLKKKKLKQHQALMKEVRRSNLL